jgi:hypothetical protein
LERDALITEEYARGFFGVDKIGRPLYVDKAGYVKADKLLQKVSYEEV